MSKKFDDRYLPATTREQELHTHKNWDLTKSQYLIYYWMVAHSCWSNNENHYYIYDNCWSQKQVASECGVSTKTVQRALTVMEEKFVLQRAPSGMKAYQIFWPHDCTAALNKDLLLSFLKLGQIVDLPIFIKAYTLLLFGFRNRVNDRRFTIADMQKALRMDSGLGERIKLLQMLALWEHLGLIALQQTEVLGDNKKSYIVYTILDIKSNLDNVEKYMSNGECDIKRAWADALQKCMESQ